MAGKKGMLSGGKKGMHAFTYSDPMHRERILDKIKGSQIMQLLVKYVESGEGLDNSRAQIALGLLRKVVPDLSSSELEIKRSSYAEDLERIQAIRAKMIEGKVIDITPHIARSELIGEYSEAGENIMSESEIGENTQSADSPSQ